MVPGGMMGRAASCTSTISGAWACNASSPARTESCRSAPPGTMGRCGMPARAPRQSAQRRLPAAGQIDMVQQALPRRGAVPVCRAAAVIASGWLPPKREPVPAATRMAAIFMRRRCDGRGGRRRQAKEVAAFFEKSGAQKTFCMPELGAFEHRVAQTKRSLFGSFSSEKERLKPRLRRYPGRAGNA